MDRKFARYLTVICAFSFILLLTILHIIKPELDPSWRVVSEYEIGQYGLLMQIAFFLLATASVGLVNIYWHQLTSKTGRIGLIWLLISAFGMILGGIFVTDPITTAKAAFTTNGILHNIGGSIMILSTPFLITLITINLLRTNLSKQTRLLLILPASMVWLGFMGYIATTVLTYHGTADSSVVIGWPNRLFIIAFSLWLIIAALASKSQKKNKK